MSGSKGSKHGFDVGDLLCSTYTNVLGLFIYLGGDSRQLLVMSTGYFWSVEDERIVRYHTFPERWRVMSRMDESLEIL